MSIVLLRICWISCFILFLIFSVSCSMSYKRKYAIISIITLLLFMTTFFTAFTIRENKRITNSVESYVFQDDSIVVKDGKGNIRTIENKTILKIGKPSNTNEFSYTCNDYNLLKSVTIPSDLYDTIVIKVGN